MAEQSSSNNRPKDKPGQNNHRRHHGRRRPPGKPNPNQGNVQRPQNENRPVPIDRIYEKYQNLLDQHLIARKKFHDLFYRADLPQKNKLERLFYSSLRDLRDFESKLLPAEKELFEKRNNGLALDKTYSELNGIIEEISTQIENPAPSDPHYMQSQKNVSHREDKEESVGSKNDYEKYKISH
jgi:hypothetical protein